MKPPPLPLPDLNNGTGWERTDAQVIAYGKACYLAALEEAAKVCETTYQEYKSGRFVTLPQFAGGDDCADAILALKEQIE